MKTVALVLGSGGARGYAHIGVIDELQRRGYRIGCIAGCSMGAVVGGIYAAGKLDEYRQWIESLDYLDVLRLLDVSFRLGAIRGERVFGKIHQILGEINIENLPIPYTAVATDLTNQQEIWFQEGCLHNAMRASAAIPSLFTPVNQGSRVLVDGGLLNPLPIVPVVSSHCDLIVAVNLNGAAHKGYVLTPSERPAPNKSQLEILMNQWLFRRGRNNAEGALALVTAEKAQVQTTSAGPASMLELLNQSVEAMQSSLTQYKIAGYPPDVLINIPKRACRFFEFYRAPELIKLGRLIAHDALERYERGES